MSQILAIFTALTAFLTSLSQSSLKGCYMEDRNIDKIDVKRDHKELIALYYYLELKSLVERLLYEHNTTNGGIKLK
jgi:hypothetical protein